MQRCLSLVCIMFNLRFPCVKKDGVLAIILNYLLLKEGVVLHFIKCKKKSPSPNNALSQDRYKFGK